MIASQRPCKDRTLVSIAADNANMEAAASAHILCKLLLPHFTHHAEMVPSVLEEFQDLRAHSGGSYCFLGFGGFRSILKPSNWPVAKKPSPDCYPDFTVPLPPHHSPKPAPNQPPTSPKPAPTTPQPRPNHPQTIPQRPNHSKTTPKPSPRHLKTRLPSQTRLPGYMV